MKPGESPPRQVQGDVGRTQVPRSLLLPVVLMITKGSL